MSINSLRILKNLILMLAMMGMPVLAASEQPTQSPTTTKPPILETKAIGLLQEFKRFAMRGNVVDLAVAVVIGGAFSKIVTSLVQDIIMPPLGALVGGVDFKHLAINLSSQPFASLEAAESAGAPLIRYGAFMQSVVDFSIIAFSVFVTVKAINSLTEEELLPPEKTPENVQLLREIRDSLKKQ
jgi:large conductance mechanosensitive channel